MNENDEEECWQIKNDDDNDESIYIVHDDNIGGMTMLSAQR